MTRESTAWSVVILAVVVVLAAGPTEAQTGATETTPKTGVTGQTGDPTLEDDVLAKIKAAGYTDIQMIEFSHGHYEFKARDRNSNRQVLLLVDPKSGKIRSRLLEPPDTPGNLVSVEEILPQVKAAGFKDVLLFEREPSLYEILTFDAQGRRVELFVNPRTGELLKHPKTGELLVTEDKEQRPVELTLTVEKIVAIVKKAGYPAVYGVSHKDMLYHVDTHDQQGRMITLHLDPKTGKLTKQP